MDAQDLNLEDRDRFKLALLRRRAELDRLLDRMRAAGWYTADPAFQCVISAQAALHAAVNHVIKLPPTVRPKPAPPPVDAGYPPPLSVEKRHPLPMSPDGAGIPKG
jgi:hypothetical protein